MKSIVTMFGVAGLALLAAPAFADAGSLEGRLAQVEQKLADSSAPSAREIQSSVDAYLASAQADATLVGGCGTAGYDGGFWIRGGSFLLKTNLTIQTRFEYFDWDDRAAEAQPGGDLSGFSLPRVTLKLSGDATCDIHYYAELEFGHDGLYAVNRTTDLTLQGDSGQAALIQGSRGDFGIAREAWIEYEAAPQVAFRMGLIKTPATRQLMTSPEMQQFVDISMASAFIGQTMPGYSDRNRDYGFMVHGALGCDGELQYMVTVTNGDGPVHRNVLDGSTDDPLAFGARVNWDIMGHMGYEEGALRQRSCEWVAAVGAWAWYFVDHAFENPLNGDFTTDRLSYGVDAAIGWGGFSMTAAYNGTTFESGIAGANIDGFSYLIQVGYLFPDTAWEIAARYSAYESDPGIGTTFSGNEMAVAVNYYIDGHSDKVTLDAAFISTDDVNLLSDTYAGYNATFDSDAILLRLQWQLAL